MSSGLAFALLVGLFPTVAPPASVEQKICNALHETDWETCRALQRPDARARCYASAMERKVQCERGKYVPPLVKE